MYHRSRKRELINWIFSKQAKIYLPILLMLGILIYFSLFNVNNSNANQELSNNEDTTEFSQEQSEAISNSVTNIDNNAYYIKVNKSKNYITVYKLDNSNQFNIAYKTFRCSVNANVSVGKFKIFEKSVWRILDTNVYAQFATRIGATYYIHSVPYSSQNTTSLISDAYNKLGSAATVGSIYVNVADSKWIYENCKNDTNVEVYENNSEEPAIALGEKTTLPYGASIDPSDNSSSNKIVQKKIGFLRGVKDKQVSVGTSINIWEGIYAADIEGNDITKYITISGNVNTDVPGTYTVTYNLIDAFGTIIAYNSVITVY